MNNLEKQVLKIIGENVSSPDVFTDDSTGMAQIRESLGFGIQQIAMASGSIRKTYHLRLREQCQFYRMGWSTDYFGYIVNAWDRSRHTKLIQTDLIRINSEHGDWMEDTGQAYEYLHIGYDYLGIWLKPSSSSVVLELDCVVIPKQYTDEKDPVKLRQNFERAAVDFAVSEFFASRGEGPRAIEWMNKAIETAQIKRVLPVQNERRYEWGKQKRES